MITWMLNTYPEVLGEIESHFSDNKARGKEGRLFTCFICSNPLILGPKPKYLGHGTKTQLRTQTSIIC